MCVADGAQVFLAGGLWGVTKQLVMASKVLCPRPAVKDWDRAGQGEDSPVW